MDIATQVLSVVAAVRARYLLLQSTDRKCTLLCQQLQGAMQEMINIFGQICPISSNPSGANSPTKQKPAAQQQPRSKPNPYPSAYPNTNVQQSGTYPQGKQGAGAYTNPYGAPPPAATRSAYPTQPYTHSTVGYGQSQYGRTQTQPQQQPQYGQSGIYGPPAPGRPAQTTQPDVNALRNILRQKLTKQYGELQRRIAPTIKEAQQTQATLTSNRDTLRVYVRNLEAQNANLTQWLEGSREAVRRLPADTQEQPKAEDAFQPATAWDRQLLELSSRDQALDEQIWELTKALEDKGRVSGADIDVTLKGVRDSAREQFECRAMIRKILNAQQTLQV
ncbi:hypothetical protein KIPB_000527 [Kipferlia bialata]|uniref:SB domain-containing protein n=1 Tax=Kipferlia bialata TaxID=797122 RepID=A0A9K3GEK7_9EUKA|nr:hypothetical protein KIPB_000527 [Kipferlia bialata]|eukprot:g527.t1